MTVGNYLPQKNPIGGAEHGIQRDVFTQKIILHTTTKFHKEIPAFMLSFLLQDDPTCEKFTEFRVDTHMILSKKRKFFG